MRPKNKTKPEDFRSKNLWKLFTLLNNLEKYYLFTGWDESSASGEALYYIEDIFIGGEEPLYAHDSVGDYPCGKMEWLRLELLNIEAGHLNRFSRTFETDAWNEQEKSAEKYPLMHRVGFQSTTCLVNADQGSTEMRQRKSVTALKVIIKCVR